MSPVGVCPVCANRVCTAAHMCMCILTLWRPEVKVKCLSFFSRRETGSLIDLEFINLARLASEVQGSRCLHLSAQRGRLGLMTRLEMIVRSDD